MNCPRCDVELFCACCPRPEGSVTLTPIDAAGNTACGHCGLSMYVMEWDEYSLSGAVPQSIDVAALEVQPGHYQHGHTLIELMVVLAIIAILAAASVPFIHSAACSRGETQECVTSAWLPAGPDRICQYRVDRHKAVRKLDNAGAPICRPVVQS